MESRMEKLLQNAFTVDETDAINKIMASYHEELPFEAYMQNTVNFLYKLRYSQKLRYIPSPEQLRFIMCKAKRIAVVAGAGSGKTRTMTNRILNEKENFGIPGPQILPITFTRNSATDMNRQYMQLCNTFGKTNDVDFKTIHKFGADFIALLSPATKIVTETNPITEWVRDTTDEDGELVEVKYTMDDLIKQALEICGIEKKEVTPKMFYSAINVIAEKLITSDQEFRESSEDYLDFPLTYDELMKIRVTYQQIKVNHGCIDFTDMLEFIHGTLKTIPKLSKVASANVVQYLTFKSIYVDEVQDVSPLQISIIKELLRLNPDCSLCVVGDDDQSIYGFRGADPSFLLNFAEIFAPEPYIAPEPQIIGIDEDGDPIYEEVEVPEPEPEPVEIIYMTKNRRSASKIIQAANLVVKNNKLRYDKAMRPMRNIEGEVNLVEDLHGIMSTGLILNTLMEEKNKGAGILSHIGILYREHKQVIPILNMLVKNRIPFNSVYDERSNFYAFNTFVTKDIMGIINMVSDLQNATLVEWYLYKLCPGINKANAAEIARRLRLEQHKSQKQRLKLSQIMKSEESWARELPRILGIYKLIDTDATMNEIVNTVYRDYYASYLGNMLKDKPDLQSVIDMSLEYLTESAEIPWTTFLSRHSATIKWVKNNYKVMNGVCLASFHAAKGLEYQKVFVLEVSDRYTPKTLILDRYSEEGRMKYIEEERRLFYVALTRAKDELTVFYNSEYPDSLFVKELREALERIELGEGVAV